MGRKTFWELNIQGSFSLSFHTSKGIKATDLKSSIAKGTNKNICMRIWSENITHMVIFCRSYYRCTYRQGRNCWATKQVQRSDEDPTLFEVTYKGTHACKQFNDAVPQPASPEKQELKSRNSCYDQLEQNPMLSNFRANLRVDTEVSDIQEMPAYFSFPSTFACNEQENYHSPISALADDNHLGTYSQLFYSPATSGSNCFSTATYQMRDYGGNDNTDIMSAHASTNNSPIGGIEFSVDPVEMDPNFPFNIPGFFT